MSKPQIRWWAYFLILLAFATSLEQKIDFGSWFEIKDWYSILSGDILHHEFFILSFFITGIALLWITKRRSNE